MKDAVKNGTKMSETAHNLSSLAYNTSYNPLDGFLTFTSIYGDNTAVQFSVLQDMVDINTNEAIVYGTRCGASVLTQIIMWMISKNRKTPVFIINQVSLTLILIHSALYFKYLLSGFGSVVYALTGFPQLIKPGDLRAFAAANIVMVLLVASIEASLIFQVKVIFTGNSLKRFGMILTGVCACMGLATVAMYFVTAVKSIVSLYKDMGGSSTVLYNISLIMLASSIHLMALILVVKLFLAVRSRRFLGLKQFDSFHILLIISCQTLLIPSLLFIIAYSFPTNKNIESLKAIAILTVVLSLPLSSMWATAANNFSNSSASYSDSGSRNAGYHSGGSLGDKSEQAHGKRGGIKNALFDLYPRSRNHATSHSAVDIENDVFNDFSKPVEKNVFSDVQALDGCSLQKISSKEDPAVTIYTPNTAIDEEGRKFWASDCSSSIDGMTPSRKKPAVEYRNIPPYLLRYEENIEEENSGTRKVSLKW